MKSGADEGEEFQDFLVQNLFWMINRDRVIFCIVSIVKHNAAIVWDDISRRLVERLVISFSIIK